jgi:hypothetical protein
LTRRGGPLRNPAVSCGIGAIGREQRSEQLDLAARDAELCHAAAAQKRPAPLALGVELEHRPTRLGLMLKTFAAIAVASRSATVTIGAS